MLPKKVITLLHPDEHKPHYIRSTTFMDGLNQAGDAFARRFRVTKPGMKRAHWAEDETRLKEKLVMIKQNPSFGVTSAHKYVGISNIGCRGLSVQSGLPSTGEDNARLSRLRGAAFLCFAPCCSHRSETCLLTATPAVLWHREGYDAIQTKASTHNHIFRRTWIFDR